MPSSKDPIINRQKAKEYRLAHPDWHRRTNREWARKKRERMGTQWSAEQRKNHKRRNPVRHLVYLAEVRARKQGLPFCLTPEDLVMPEVCPVFETPFEWGVGVKGWRNLHSPSLDRIKPQLGYVKDNVRIISNRANHLKSNGTISEFRAVLAYMEREGCNETLADQVSAYVGPSATAQLEMGW